MIRFIIMILLVFFVFFSFKYEQVQDQILIRFISAFDDENTIENWKGAHSITNIYGEKTFKRVVKSVRDIISVINSEKYIEVNLLIIRTNMNHKKIGFPFYETWVVIESVKRILKLNNKQNDFLSIKHDISKFDEMILYEEYVNIYRDLVTIMHFLGLPDDFFNVFNTFSKDGFKRWIKNNNSKSLLNSTVIRGYNGKKFNKNMDLAHDLIESILPVDYKKPVYVLAHSEGFGRSRKSSGEGIKGFTMNKSTSVYSQEMLNVRPIKCQGQSVWGSNIYIEYYMKRPFLCDKTIAKTLIVLFHYFSQLKSKHTTYEVFLTRDIKYLIKWSFYEQTLDFWKKYWLQKEVNNLSNQYIIPKFGFIVDYGIEYSTVNSEDTENEGIKTRLILLDCGHQLGLDLIDEFFAYFYSLKKNLGRVIFVEKLLRYLETTMQLSTNTRKNK